MSDESSLGSPRHKTPDLKATSSKQQMPWWAEEDSAEDVVNREAVRKSWMKPKISELEEEDPQPDEIDQEREKRVIRKFHCV